MQTPGGVIITPEKALPKPCDPFEQKSNHVSLFRTRHLIIHQHAIAQFALHHEIITRQGGDTFYATKEELELALDCKLKCIVVRQQ